MRTSMQQLYVYTVTCGLVAVLILSLVADARVVKRSPVGVDECQYECTNDVYKCDLRCKYLKFLKGDSLKKCHGQCADNFLDCFLNCFDVDLSFYK